MKSNSSCPTPEIMQALLDCKLSEEQQSELLQHLEPSDPTTRAALKAALFDDDPFVQVTAIGLCAESGDVSRRALDDIGWLACDCLAVADEHLAHPSDGIRWQRSAPSFMLRQPRG